MHPIEANNVILIIVGVVLVISGFVINYRTIRGLLKDREKQTKLGINYYFNFVFNIVIGVLFVFAGILFVVNNLKGNPLHFKTQTESDFRTA